MPLSKQDMLHRYLDLAALADDSGLEVDALDGAPGIYSARYAGINASDSDNIQRLLSAMKDVPEGKRNARFQCLLVYVRHPKDPTPIICQGTWQGSILLAPQGNGGFGYDPIFFVPSHQCSSAQLPKATKNEISHRAQALQQFIDQIDHIIA